MAKFEYPSIKLRFSIFVFLLLGILILSFILFGTIFPSDSKQALIVQGGLLLIVLGSLILEDKFTKPADAVVNALAVIISLVPLYSTAPYYWGSLLIYSSFIFLSGMICIFLGFPHELKGAKKFLSLNLSKIFTVLGAARVIFSITFLMAVFSQYNYKSYQTIILICFWAISVVIWPLKIPNVLQFILASLLDKGKIEPTVCGKILRSDNPDILKIELDIEKNVQNEYIVACQGDNTHSIVKPLLSRFWTNGSF